MNQNAKSPEKESPSSDLSASTGKLQQILPAEYGGRKGLEATRYGDWEINGKCVDF